MEAEDPEVTSFHGHTEITATSVQLKLTKQKNQKTPNPPKTGRIELPQLILERTRVKEWEEERWG